MFSGIAIAISVLINAFPFAGTTPSWALLKSRPAEKGDPREGIIAKSLSFLIWIVSSDCSIKVCLTFWSFPFALTEVPVDPNPPSPLLVSDKISTSSIYKYQKLLRLIVYVDKITCFCHWYLFYNELSYSFSPLHFKVRLREVEQYYSHIPSVIIIDHSRSDIDTILPS